MRLVKPSVVLRGIYGGLEDLEDAGRTCYKSEDKITPESAKGFVAGVLKRDHGAVIEHMFASFRIICDRGVTHEIVRHRLASYCQESTRYVDYNKEDGKTGGHCVFVIPPWVNVPEGEYVEDQCLDTNAENGWFHAMLASEATYRVVSALGWKPEQARSVLPNSTKTEIVMTTNMREWRHFLKLRTAKAAHPQMREVANMILGIFLEKVPELVMDIGAINE